MCWLARIAMMMFLALGVEVANATKILQVDEQASAYDLLGIAEFRDGNDGRVQVSTAPGLDGIVRRIEVRSLNPQLNPRWLVFALANTSDKQIDRLVAAPFFRLSGSRIFWPELGSRRITNIASSAGISPVRLPDPEADVYRVTLDPGSIVTFVVELSARDLPELTLWEPAAYKDSINSFTLYRGIVMGISGLLALFLTILFVVKGTAMFPAAAGIAWAVLGYLSVDFGFTAKVFLLSPGGEQLWRAGSEILMGASLVVFLFAYLHLHRWHVRYSHLVGLWMIVLLSSLGIALFDPSIAAGLARLSIGLAAVFGLVVILFLSITKYDRAVMLIPTWLLLVGWVVAAGLTASGQLDNDLVQPALGGGLVLIVMLIGFTVMQHAFAGGAIAQGIVSDSERKILALTGAGDVVWDWDVLRDRIHTSGEAEDVLGLARGTLEGPASDWFDVLHPGDKDRFRSTLDAVIDHRRGRISQDFRLRASDGHYLWFKLRARPVVGTDGEVIRCVGTLLDVTEQRFAEERMLHDAIHDNLTGLPNRELFLDRLEIALCRANIEGISKPSVLLVDVDSFKTINEKFGLSVGDSVLLTLARRMSRLLKPQDSLARIGSDQFAIILLSDQKPERIAIFADAVRKGLRAPISFGDKEILLTVSSGIAVHDPAHKHGIDLLNDADIAMHHAKRLGGNRIESFRATLRQYAGERTSMETDLRRALELDEIEVVYQPIVNLHDKLISGFEALARWHHPTRGRIAPRDFIPVAEQSGLIVPLGLFVMEQAARQLSEWQQMMTGPEPLFMSVNVSSRQVLRHDLINDVKAVLARSSVERGTLKLELTESLVMENPEYASRVLNQIRELGAGLSIDDFGTGYSSLSHLQNFPFDTIKIDQSFVRSNGKPAQSVILRSIVGLAHDLGLDIVAEGAETEADAIGLYQMGCTYAQGFLFGQPMNAADARNMLDQQLALIKSGYHVQAVQQGNDPAVASHPANDMHYDDPNRKHVAE
ncbi:MAG: EAL domain-containing protein [Cohaesibacteraceae bacterium]|nr:EAL domain-containing protein [Cohaesibacteraceae bacterium]